MIQPQNTYNLLTQFILLPTPLSPLNLNTLFLPLHAVFLCVQRMVWLPVFEILNGGTYTDACNCTQGLYGHGKGVCTGSCLQERKTSFATMGNQNSVSLVSGFWVCPLYSRSYPITPRFRWKTGRWQNPECFRPDWVWISGTAGPWRLHWWLL